MFLVLTLLIGAGRSGGGGVHPDGASAASLSPGSLVGVCWCRSRARWRWAICRTATSGCARQRSATNRGIVRTGRTHHALTGLKIFASATLVWNSKGRRPAVQVGGGIASVLGRTLGLRPEKVKSLIPVGAAAAVAAAFNTPLAAVLFALEEVMSDLHAPILGSVVLASATSWGVMRLVLGNDPLFQVPQYQLVNPWELLIYGCLGIAGGLVSAAFS